MTTALVGYTGFVGSNLASRHKFDDLYNTNNIHEIAGKSYKLVVSGANRADSFRINQNPEEDLRDVTSLVDQLSKTTIEKLVLISTVCVYPGDTSPDETTLLTEHGLTPYGQNRLHQERRLGEIFDTTIIRLPQLYGDNLKKGVIYDLLNDYRVEHIDPEGMFQYYDLRRVWGDIEIALRHGLTSFNASTPAIASAQIAREVFGVDISKNPTRRGDAYSEMYTRDMRTRHASLFGGKQGYLLDVESELRGIRSFAETFKARESGE